jgi:hypothetical protein
MEDPDSDEYHFRRRESLPNKHETADLRQCSCPGVYEANTLFKGLR